MTEFLKAVEYRLLEAAEKNGDTTNPRDLIRRISMPIVEAYERLESLTSRGYFQADEDSYQLSESGNRALRHYHRLNKLRGRGAENDSVTFEKEATAKHETDELTPLEEQILDRLYDHGYTTVGHAFYMGELRQKRRALQCAFDGLVDDDYMKRRYGRYGLTQKGVEYVRHRFNKISPPAEQKYRKIQFGAKR